MTGTKRARAALPASWLVVATLGLASAPASAEGDAAAAEQLYKEAKALAKAGNYAEACPKFDASYKLDKGLGTLVNLADCNERVGKTATAWAQWNEAADLARREKDKREKFAAERRDKLEPKLAKLKVEVANPVASLAVYRADSKLEPASFGVALAVDPGEVAVSVRRGDKILKTETVSAKEASTSSVSFDLAAIDKEFPEEKASPAPTVAPTATPTASAPPPPPPPPPSSSQKTIGWVVGGVGVAALLTAGALEVVAASKKSKADEPDQCLNGYCSPNGIETVDSAKRYATIGQWVGVGGVLFTAVGATLILTAPSSAESPAKAGLSRGRLRAGVSPYVAPTGGGLVLHGAL
ncbi:MAG: hypothetical protein U0263_02960 [Polyangiaceae bacterium]